MIYFLSPILKVFCVLHADPFAWISITQLDWAVRASFVDNDALFYPVYVAAVTSWSLLLLCNATCLHSFGISRESSGLDDWLALSSCKTLLLRWLFYFALKDTRQKSGIGGDKGHYLKVKHLLNKALRKCKVKSRFSYVLKNPHFNKKISNTLVPEGLEIHFFTQCLLLLPYRWYLLLRILSCTVHVTLYFCLCSAFTPQVLFLLSVFSAVVRTLKVMWCQDNINTGYKTILKYSPSAVY